MGPDGAGLITGQLIVRSVPRVNGLTVSACSPRPTRSSARASSMIQDHPFRYCRAFTSCGPFGPMSPYHRHRVKERDFGVDDIDLLAVVDDMAAAPSRGASCSRW